MPTPLKQRIASATQNIQLGHIIAVLLTDGWHRVRKGSFEVGPLVLFTMDSESKTLYYSSRHHTEEGSPLPYFFYAKWEEGMDPENSLAFHCPFSEIRCMKVDFWGCFDNDGNLLPEEPEEPAAEPAAD